MGICRAWARESAVRTDAAAAAHSATDVAVGLMLEYWGATGDAALEAAAGSGSWDESSAVAGAPVRGESRAVAGADGVVDATCPAGCGGCGDDTALAVTRVVSNPGAAGLGVGSAPPADGGSRRVAPDLLTDLSPRGSGPAPPAAELLDPTLSRSNPGACAQPAPELLLGPESASDPASSAAGAAPPVLLDPGERRCDTGCVDLRTPATTCAGSAALPAADSTLAVLSLT